MCACLPGSVSGYEAGRHMSDTSYYLSAMDGRQTAASLCVEFVAFESGQVQADATVCIA